MNESSPLAPSKDFEKKNRAVRYRSIYASLVQREVAAIADGGIVAEPWNNPSVTCR